MTGLQKLAFIATVTLTNGTAFAANCPDFESPRCLEEIRRAVDRHDYNEARDAAEAQCWTKPTEIMESLAPTALVTVASGCYQLYSIERFLDQPLNAVAARDKAQHIATWGCERGVDDLCDVLLGLMQRRIMELIGEFSAEAAHQKDEFFPELAIRNVLGTRIMPKSLIAETRKSVHEVLAAKLNRTIGDCVECQPAAASKEKVGRKSTPPFVLDLTLGMAGAEMRLDARVFDTSDYHVVWERTYRTRDLSERHKLFGFASLESSSMVEYRRIEDYQPLYKFNVGLGAASIPNITGNSRDASRFVTQVRAVERFNERRSEVGLLLSVHVTRRTAEEKLKDKERKEAEEDAEVVDTDVTNADAIKPYPTSMTLAAIYNRMLFGGRESYDTVRHSIGGGFGALFSSDIIAPTARLSWDVYFGRHYYMDVSAVVIGATTLVLDDSGKKTKTVGGGEVAFGFTW